MITKSNIAKLIQVYKILFGNDPSYDQFYKLVNQVKHLNFNTQLDKVGEIFQKEFPCNTKKTEDFLNSVLKNSGFHLFSQDTRDSIKGVIREAHNEHKANHFKFAIEFISKLFIEMDIVDAFQGDKTYKNNIQTVIDNLDINAAELANAFEERFENSASAPDANAAFNVATIEQDQQTNDDTDNAIHDMATEIANMMGISFEEALDALKAQEIYDDAKLNAAVIEQEKQINNNEVNILDKAKELAEQENINEEELQISLLLETLAANNNNNTNPIMDEMAKTYANELGISYEEALASLKIEYTGQQNNITPEN